jgi:hypothetical protein
MKNKLAKRSRKLSRVCPDAARICDEVAAWLSGDEGYSPQALAEALTQAAMELRDFDKWDKKALGLIDVAMSQLREEKAALLKAFKAAVERMEAVSEGIPVEKRSAGVSQATHVRHMAGHLAQHAKIARAAIARAEGRE